MASQSDKWTWMIVVIVMIAITSVIAVVTLACKLFCKCKKEVRRKRVVGVAGGSEIDNSDMTTAIPELPDATPSRSNKRRSNRVTPVLTQQAAPPSTGRTSVDDRWTPRDTNMTPADANYLYTSRQAWMFEPD